MADYKYKIKLSDLLKPNEKIAIKDKEEANKKIGELAIKLMKSDMDKSRSPITGTPYKSKADKTRSHLKETGDLQAGLKDTPKKLAVELYISGEKNKLKAENHNKRGPDGEIIARAAATAVPQREFFPTKGHGLRPGIIKQLRKEIENLLIEK